MVVHNTKPTKKNSSNITENIKQHKRNNKRNKNIYHKQQGLIIIHETVLSAKTQFQDCIIALIPIQQIQHFTLELKEENFVIQNIQKLLKKIETKTFYIKIESIFKL